MAPVGTISAVDTVKRRALPHSKDGTLWGGRGEFGVFDFRGSRLRIGVPATDEVLFPTDCGLSLLAALRDDAATEIRGKRALDIGCGSGVYSVALLSAGAEHVTALDINGSAADVTRENISINHLDQDRLTTVTCDLAHYTPDEPFDLVIANPPHLPYSPVYAAENGLELALVGGADGRALYDIAVDRATDLVAPGGTLIFVHSSLTDIPLTKRRLAEQGFEARTIEVFEMDIPLRAYAEHAGELSRKLEALRVAGKADFQGNRFTVHILAFQRTGGGAILENA